MGWKDFFLFVLAIQVVIIYICNSFCISLWGIVWDALIIQTLL